MSPSETVSIPRVTPVQFVGSLVIAAGLLWWFSRGVDLEAVATRLADVRLPYLIAAVGVSLGTMTYRAVRWRALIAPLGRPSLRALVSCIYMGWAVSAVLPGRLGEMVRPILLGRREGMSRSALFGTVVFERVLDVLAVLVLLAVYLTFVLPSRGSEGEVVPLLLALRAGGWLLLGSIAGGAVVVGIANRLPQRLTDFVKTAVERLPGPVGRRGWHILSSFGTGLLAAWAHGLSSRQAGPPPAVAPDAHGCGVAWCLLRAPPAVSSVCPRCVGLRSDAFDQHDCGRSDGAAPGRRRFVSQRRSDRAHSTAGRPCRGRDRVRGRESRGGVCPIRLDRSIPADPGWNVNRARAAAISRPDDRRARPLAWGGRWREPVRRSARPGGHRCPHQ